MQIGKDGILLNNRSQFPLSNRDAQAARCTETVGWRTSPPSILNLSRFRKRQSIFDFDAEVSDRSLYLGVPE